MKEKTYFLNTLLAVMAGIALLAAVAVRVFVPIASIPMPGIPELTLFSLLVMLVEHYSKKGGKRCYLCVFLLSAVTFGVLPFAAGFVPAGEIWKMALVGGAVFTATAWTFEAVQERMRSGRSGMFTPIVNAIGIYLAVQCFAGMF